MKMDHPSNLSLREAHVQMIVQLCDAIKTFVTVVEPQTRSEHATPVAAVPNDNDENQSLPQRHWPDDVIGLRDILAEYGLRSSQVAKLRERWGFPSPLTNGRRLLFSRSEIDRWAHSQPNRDNLAIVLRIRSRQPNLLRQDPR
jgi:predicted DNA-binding transcriptional regulator AlpA